MMSRVRQRLLLVAGWAVAAIGSSLVASAAVAVAGGQVSDRPLRPLTAAEVAALPIRETTGGSVPSEPLASGGFVTTTGAPVVGERGTPARRPADDELEFPEEDESSLLPGSGRPEIDAARPAPLDLPPVEVVSRLTAAEGGTVGFTGTEGRVALAWATPQPGYVMRVIRNSPDVVEVSFENTDRRTLVRAVWLGDDIAIETVESDL